MKPFLLCTSNVAFSIFTYSFLNSRFYDEQNEVGRVTMCFFKRMVTETVLRNESKLAKKRSWRRHGAIPVLSLMAHSTCTPFVHTNFIEEETSFFLSFSGSKFFLLSYQTLFLVHEIFVFLTSFSIKLSTILLLWYGEVPNDEMKIHIEKDEEY